MLIRLLLTIMIFVVSLVGENLSKTSFDINKWMTYYYENPQPEKFEIALDILSESKGLSKKNALAPLGSFFAVLFEKNENKASQWVNYVKKLDELERKVFIFALYYSNIEDKYNYIKKLVQTKKEKDLFEHIKKLRFIKIVDMEVISPRTLDQHWGGFLASGDEKHIYQIINTLSFGGIENEEKSGKYKILEGAAKWSLTSNAYKHKKVLDICNYFINNPKLTTPELHMILKEIVFKVENRNKEKINTDSKI